MGKGDIKTKKGKISAGSYGVSRPRKTKKSATLIEPKKESTKKSIPKKTNTAKKKSSKSTTKKTSKAKKEA